MFKLFLILVIQSLLYIELYSQPQPEWKIYNASNSPLPDDNVRNIEVDQFNNKWISTIGGLIKITGDDFTNFSNWTLVTQVMNLNCLESDSAGKLWLGNIASGLVKYDGQNFIQYNTQNSPIPYNVISGITIDLANNIWIMNGMQNFTQQIYLVKFDGANTWQQLPGNFGFQTMGDLGAVDSSGNLWTATEQKLTRINTITNTITEWNTFGLGQYVTEVKPDFKGNVWIAGGMAGWGGLVKFDGQNFTSYNFEATALAVDAQKNLWVGTDNVVSDTLKLLRYDGTNWAVLTPYNSSLPQSNGITNLEFDTKGNLWIAMLEGGVAVYKEGGVVIPVELVSFTAEANNSDVLLYWVTASEVNNNGFEIERIFGGDAEWRTISFVPGKGTTTERTSYSFRDNNISPGHYSYRLKQIDLDGSFEYSDVVEVSLSLPLEYILEQNYPNPFNPLTTIKYSIAAEGLVNLSVYNLLGQKVAELKNEVMQPGYYETEFDASSLSSGVYVYKLSAGEKVITRKMVVLK